MSHLTSQILRDAACIVSDDATQKPCQQTYSCCAVAEAEGVVKRDYASSLAAREYARLAGEAGAPRYDAERNRLFVSSFLQRDAHGYADDAASNLLRFDFLNLLAESLA